MLLFGNIYAIWLKYELPELCNSQFFGGVIHYINTVLRKNTVGAIRYIYNNVSVHLVDP